MQILRAKILGNIIGGRVTYKYFKDEEVEGLSGELVLLLDAARELAGFAFVITSGFRTPDHNADVGGVEGSSHLTGNAVDLPAPAEPFLREKMAWALGRAGFRRVFSYPHHFHADIDSAKTQDIFGEKEY